MGGKVVFVWKGEEADTFPDESNVCGIAGGGKWGAPVITVVGSGVEAGLKVIKKL